MNNQDVTKIKTLGERVNFAPNKRDEQKIVWLVNNSDGEDGISDVMRESIAILYYLEKTGKIKRVRKEMLQDFE